MVEARNIVATEVRIPTADGEMNGWRFAQQPLGETPRRPAVIVLMDAPGIRPALHDIARRIAQHGYLVLLPNLYYRIGYAVQIGPTRGHPDAQRNRDELVACVQTLGNPMVVRDVASMIDSLKGDPGWNGGLVGLTGYCMSGRFAVLAATSMPTRVACAASYFGTRLITDLPDSPHLGAASAQAELYFAFAETDHYVPLEMVERFAAHLGSGSVRHRVEVYPGTEHGFVFPDRGSYQETGARRHWESLFQLLDRNLPTC